MSDVTKSDKGQSDGPGDTIDLTAFNFRTRRKNRDIQIADETYKAYITTRETTEDNTGKQ